MWPTVARSVWVVAARRLIRAVVSERAVHGLDRSNVRHLDKFRVSVWAVGVNREIGLLTDDAIKPAASLGEVPMTSQTPVRRGAEYGASALREVAFWMQQSDCANTRGSTPAPDHEVH